MTEVSRSQDGRPYIIPPGEDEPKLYTRASKLASALDDGYGLDLWHQRMVALGIYDNQWLLKEIDAARDEPKELDALCSIARDKAGENTKSAWGTVIHWFTECIDGGLDWAEEPLNEDVEKSLKSLGQTLDEVYEEAEDDLIAYEHATQGLETLLTEQFVVCDEVRAAGSADRISFYDKIKSNMVVDLKTGRIDFNALKFAMQMAIYARSLIYKFNEDTGKWERHPLPYVDRDRALLIHLPKGEGVCKLYYVDIAKGWEAVQFAMQLKDIRNNSKKWLRDVNLPAPVPVPALPNDGEGMKVSELREFAKKWSIPLGGKTKKADILEICKSAKGLIFE